MTCGIYKIQNRINGDCYIGQSKNIEVRWETHKTIGRNYNLSYANISLYKAFYNYGLTNFEFSILEECQLDQLDEKEIYWIKYYDSFNNGYNMTPGGQGLKTIGKLSENQVLEIIELLKNSNYTQIEIGDMFGVNVNSISCINTGKYWYQNNIEYPIRKPNYIYCKCKICGKRLNNGRASKTNLCWECYKKTLSPQKPSREKLKQQIRTMTLKSICDFYQIKDREIIRRWCRELNLPQKSEVKNYSDEEWSNL